MFLFCNEKTPHLCGFQVFRKHLFVIRGKEKTGRYHIESQSTEDNSMQIRMFEYDTQIALEHAEITREGMVVELPKAAVIYLRSSKNTPSALKVKVKTPGGNVTYEVPIIKLSRYTVEELFEKKLYFLIPFHIFVYENLFLVYDKDEEKLSELKKVYEVIMSRLEALCEAGALDEYTRHCIMDMSGKVLNSLAAKYGKVREGIGEVMGGKVLDYEAKRIYNAGKVEGRNEGRSEGALNICISLIKNGLITLAEAAKQLRMSEAELQKYM